MVSCELGIGPSCSPFLIHNSNFTILQAPSCRESSSGSVVGVLQA
jgi:hypothetical protein